MNFNIISLTNKYNLCSEDIKSVALGSVKGSIHPSIHHLLLKNNTMLNHWPLGFSNCNSGPTTTNSSDRPQQ